MVEASRWKEIRSLRFLFLHPTEEFARLALLEFVVGQPVGLGRKSEGSCLEGFREHLDWPQRISCGFEAADLLG